MSHFNDEVAIVILADIDTERAQEAAAGIAGAGGDAEDSKDGPRFPLASDRKLIRGS